MSGTSSAQVEISVEGEIEASCALSGLTSSVTGLDFNTPGSTTLDYIVDCNAPFAYALESAGQSFELQAPSIGVSPGSAAFEASLDYTITSNFITDNGSFSDTLNSAELTAGNAAPCTAAAFDPACSFSDSGTDVAANPSGNNASLQIAWGSTANPLIAGSYQDTLTLTVRVK
ncbi:hypothetical protein [Ponticaulis profundi]|uniref:Spore coat protein U domain-containing protein n=1 Tax=Ponticaulis profundi TaxID=2665222 RepID=A0ABW1SE50_9PROT